MKSILLLRRKTIIYIIIMILITGCSSGKDSHEIESLNNKLDILSMTIYKEELYVGTTMGLFVLAKDQSLEKIELEYPIGFIYELFVHDQYGLFIGGLNGLLVMDDSNNQTYYGEDILPDKRVYSINMNNEGHTFIGTFDGLLVLDENLKVVEQSYELLSEMVNVIEFGFNSSILLASYNVRGGGLTIIEDGQSTFYNNDSGLASINTTSLIAYEDIFFIGGGMYESGGLNKYVYRNGGYEVIKSYEVSDGLAGPKVRSLLLKDHMLLVGSEYDGFSILNLDDMYSDIVSYRVYTTKNGLSHNEVKCMIEYNDYIYLGTKAGLSRMPVSEL